MAARETTVGVAKGGRTTDGGCRDGRTTDGGCRDEGGVTRDSHS